MTCQRCVELLAVIDRLRYALATARDTDNIFDLIKICDDALAVRPNDRELRIHDINWIREIDKYKAGHNRYEKVRTLNVPQFQALFLENLKGEKTFDQLVDELK
jgi:hypothetical protein